VEAHSADTHRENDGIANAQPILTTEWRRKKLRGIDPEEIQHGFLMHKS
jgi:hypothetical protein